MQIVPLSPGSVSFTPLRSSFHPSLRFTLNSTSPSPSSYASSSSCILHLELSFPDALFIDRDELRDSLHRIEWTLDPDVIDIERPVRSDVPLSRLRISPSVSSCASDEIICDASVEMQVKIPMHGRYLEPDNSGHRLVWLFAGEESGELRGGWVCGLPPSQDVQLPLVPTLPLSIDLPTGRPAHQRFVELGTAATVWVCFAYLVYKIWKTYRRLDETKKRKTT